MSDPVPDFDDWIRARGADHRALARLRQGLGTTEEVSRT
jgi:hypothetical protein